jgi:hypothetical protein
LHAATGTFGADNSSTFDLAHASHQATPDLTTVAGLASIDSKPGAGVGIGSGNPDHTHGWGAGLINPDDTKPGFNTLFGHHS